LKNEYQRPHHGKIGGWAGSGAREGGQTHYRINIASARFSGKGRLERHRMVYALLADEIAQGVHALALHTQAPDEQ
jgi:BolA protein